MRRRGGRGENHVSFQRIAVVRRRRSRELTPSRHRTASVIGNGFLNRVHTR
jgi:hypothetical protein